MSSISSGSSSSPVYDLSTYAQEASLQKEKVGHIDIPSQYIEKKKPCCDYTAGKYVYMSNAAGVLLSGVACILSAINNTQGNDYFLPKTSLLCCTSNCTECPTSLTIQGNYTDIFINSPTLVKDGFFAYFPPGYNWLFVTMGIAAVGMLSFSFIRAKLNQKPHYPCNKVQWITTGISTFIIFGCSIGISLLTWEYLASSSLLPCYVNMPPATPCYVNLYQNYYQLTCGYVPTFGYAQGRVVGC